MARPSSHDSSPVECEKLEVSPYIIYNSSKPDNFEVHESERVNDAPNHPHLSNPTPSRQVSIKSESVVLDYESEEIDDDSQEQEIFLPHRRVVSPNSKSSKLPLSPATQPASNRTDIGSDGRGSLTQHQNSGKWQNKSEERPGVLLASQDTTSLQKINCHKAIDLLPRPDTPDGLLDSDFSADIDILSDSPEVEMSVQEGRTGTWINSADMESDIDVIRVQIRNQIAIAEQNQSQQEQQSARHASSSSSLSTTNTPVLATVVSGPPNTGSNTAFVNSQARLLASEQLWRVQCDHRLAELQLEFSRRLNDSLQEHEIKMTELRTIQSQEVARNMKRQTATLQALQRALPDCLKEKEITEIDLVGQLASELNSCRDELLATKRQLAESRDEVEAWRELAKQLDLKPATKGKSDLSAQQRPSGLYELNPMANGMDAKLSVQRRRLAARYNHNRRSLPLSSEEPDYMLMNSSSRDVVGSEGPWLAKTWKRLETSSGDEAEAEETDGLIPSLPLFASGYCFQGDRKRSKVKSSYLSNTGSNISMSGLRRRGSTAFRNAAMPSAEPDGLNGREARLNHPVPCRPVSMFEPMSLGQLTSGSHNPISLVDKVSQYERDSTFFGQGLGYTQAFHPRRCSKSRRPRSLTPLTNKRTTSVSGNLACFEANQPVKEENTAPVEIMHSLHRISEDLDRVMSVLHLPDEVLLAENNSIPGGPGFRASYSPALVVKHSPLVSSQPSLSQFRQRGQARTSTHATDRLVPAYLPSGKNWPPDSHASNLLRLQQQQQTPNISALATSGQRLLKSLCPATNRTWVDNMKRDFDVSQSTLEKPAPGQTTTAQLEATSENQIIRTSLSSEQDRSMRTAKRSLLIIPNDLLLPSLHSISSCSSDADILNELL
ncbi:unnamed protein product [Protopolystoma xenopodis]|uniref:Uncharacterized protein n=1 Tax=Protopolystoma xenopodis TaxID=117903 RepID=A0A448XI39_9PLAT|nr:unnamed protein product [Protopolystoma xenopodis]